MTTTHAGMLTPRAIVSPFPSLELPLPGIVVEVVEDADEVIMRVEIKTFPLVVTVVVTGGVVVVECVVVIGVAQLSH
jgi:hypothetical protein